MIVNDIIKDICEKILPYDKNRILMYFSIPNTEFFDTYIANIMIFTASKEAYRKYHPFSSRKNLRPETIIGNFNIDFKEVLSDYSEENDVEKYALKFLNTLKNTMREVYERNDFIGVAFRNPKDSSKIDFDIDNSELMMRALTECIFLSTCDDKGLELSEIVSDENSENFGKIKFRLSDSTFPLGNDAIEEIAANEYLCPQLKKALKNFYEKVNKFKSIEAEINSKIDEKTKLLLEFTNSEEEDDDD